MATDRPLLDTPLRDWTYEALDQFLEARIREDERIEYKAKFTDDNFTDTLVSMANGDGGTIVFVDAELRAISQSAEDRSILASEEDRLATVTNE